MGSLFNNNKKEEGNKSPTKVSLFGNNNDPSKDSKKPDTGLTLFDNAPKANVFNFNNNNAAAANQNQQKKEEPASGGIFKSLTAPTGNLFSNTGNSNNNIFSSNTTGSIFGTLKNDSPIKTKSPMKEDPPKEGGLFANLKKSNTETGSGLFAGL